MFLGVYDRWAMPPRFEDEPMDVEHDFVSWEKADEAFMLIENIRKKGRVPLLTVEPFTTASGEPQQVLTDTVRGKNDATISALADAVRKHHEQVVIVRFAHEMELIGNYPWSQPDTALYIQAFRHVVDLFRERGATNARWVFGPAGNDNAPGYYPGDDYVDYVAVAVLGSEAWDIRGGNARGSTFVEIFTPKYQRVVQFGKPVILPELGVSATTEGRTPEEVVQYKDQWLKDAFQALESFPMLRGVVYHNALNVPNRWMGDTPDWRINSHLLWAPDDMPVLDG